MNDLEQLKRQLRKFAEDRDWNQFHSPKNLAMALCGEAGELAECFQWLTEQESRNLSKAQLASVADEIADIQLYLVRLADKLGIDIISESLRKIDENAKKYPVDKAKGNANKYSDL